MGHGGAHPRIVGEVDGPKSRRRIPALESQATRRLVRHGGPILLQLAKAAGEVAGNVENDDRVLLWMRMVEVEQVHVLDAKEDGVVHRAHRGAARDALDDAHLAKK